MKSILSWTLGMRKRGTIGWSIGVAALVFINMIFYPSFKNDAEELQKSFENLPEAALGLLGGSNDFFSPIGFLNSQIYFLMLPLLLIILAINLGSNLLAREEQDGTIELLLARPVSRSRLLLGKAAAGCVILFVVSVVGLLATLVVGKAVGLEVAATSIIAASFACFLLALSIGAIAFCLSAFGKARKASYGIAAIAALGGYLVVSLAGTVDWLAGPSRVFPFHYYQSESILRGDYNWLNILFFVGVIMAAWLLARRAFNNRDIG